MLGWEENRGIIIDKNKINYLRFADDIILMSDNIPEKCYDKNIESGLKIYLYILVADKNW